MIPVSGAAIVRNGIKLGYPFVESIRSLLPFCSEVVVGVGDSEDGTRKQVEAIGDPKIRIIDTRWDARRRTGGYVLSEQTNLVLDECRGAWIFYLQADEVAYEKDFDRLSAALAAARDDERIEGIAFDYLHFYGSFFTVQSGRNWYRQEVRIIRNRRGIRSHGDAQGFRRGGRKVRALLSGARMYHYGWARPPEVMREKITSFHAFWHDDDWIRENCTGLEAGDYFTDLGNLVPFEGDHPAVMKEKITREFEPFIRQCRADYLRRRTVPGALRDWLRRLPFGENRNFTPVRER